VRQLRTPCADPAATGWIRAPPSTASKGTTIAIKDKVRSDKISDPAQIDPRLGPDPKPTRDKVTAEVTYIPGDGDPHRVTWGGLEFKAHIPTLVPLTHAISVPMRTLAERAGVFLTA
jgi:hypothetical protein